MEEVGGRPQAPGREDPAPHMWGRRKLGDTPKPPAGRPLHPICGGELGSNPPSLRQGDPCTPCDVIIGDTPKPPVGKPRHHLLWGLGLLGDTPKPRQGSPCTPIDREGYTKST